MMSPAQSLNPGRDDDDVDGCDHVLRKADPADETTDHELPASAGGVELVEQVNIGGDDVDGCVCDMDTEDAPFTKDLELPAAEGGVA